MTFSVAFFSNYLSPHQVPFCNEMYAAFGDRFKFIATSGINKSRLALKWKLDDDYPYVIRYLDSPESAARCHLLGQVSDVVIIGAAPDGFIKDRVARNKLTFRYSERLFRRGFWRLLSPRTFWAAFNSHTRLRNSNIYMLCASGYTPYDCQRIFAYPGKMFKWGYFTEFKEYDLQELMAKKSPTKEVRLLWVGRFLELKQTEQAIFVAKRLRDEGYSFRLDIIGTGDREEFLRALVAEHELEGRVEFLGPMPSDEVRTHMEQADVFLFTSNAQEGWGAVLNEAMNSGCAVVASHAIGAVPFLLTHRENGLIYKNGDIDDLFRKVKYLADNPDERRRLGRNAAVTIEKEWNPRQAVGNLIKLMEALLKGRQAVIASGPGSKAEVISDDYLADRIG